MFTACTRFAAAVLVLFAASHASAQSDKPASAPAADKPTPATAPADRTPIKAKVVELKGDVRYAPIDADDWKPAKLGDEYPERTRILTGIRSAVKLQIGDQDPYTCLLIDAVGKTIIGEACITGDTKKVHLGVGYGRVKGGVAEVGRKSELTVDSPAATLSKRGTWGFSLFYERDSDAFEIGLSDRGLVDAINKATTDARTIKPGESITQAMRIWLDEAQFKNTPVADIMGQSDIELAFNRIDQEGLGVLGIGSGREIVFALNSPDARATFADLLERSLLNAPLNLLSPEPALRREGLFGTGRGDQLIPILLSEAQKHGASRTVHLRRSAAEAWLKSNKH